VGPGERRGSVFKPEEYDVLIAAAEAYPSGFGFVYAVTRDRCRVERTPVGLEGFLEQHPDAQC
jgi:hypothetical protein